MKILHLLSGGGIGGIEMLCCDIAELSKNQNEFCFLYSGGVIAEKMRENNIPVYSYYEENVLIRMNRLFSLVKRKQYEVVIVHHEGTGIYLFYLMLLYCFRKIKFIKYLHCSFEGEYFYQGKVLKDKIDYFFLKKVLKKSDGIVAVSEYVKRSYYENFVHNTDKIKVIYNGIRITQKTGETFKGQVKDEPLQFLYIGRLVEVKGIHLLLYAMKDLIAFGKNVKLDILGDGPLRFEYEELTRNLGLTEKVHFYGYRLDKQEFFDRAHVFIYPSIWQEAFGISIVEALSQGILCVASDGGGIPEIISDGKDGFLFQRGNRRQLTEVLLKAISCYESPKYQEITEAARRKSCQFDIYKTIGNLDKFLNSCSGK